MTCTQQDLCTFTNNLLDSHLFRNDYCHNGCQVDSDTSITHIATATSASLSAIEHAIHIGAQALVVHHGIIWGSIDHIGGFTGKRIRTLLQGHCSLLAWHLPLDAHPKHGNNAHALSGLGAQQEGSFAPYKNVDVGLYGTLPETITAEELTARCATLFDHDVIHVPGGPKKIKRIGVVTGGGQNYLCAAADAGLDALITGETSEQTWHEAAECKTHCFACGHAATETHAIHALGQNIAQEFGLEHSCINIPNPL